MENWRKFWSELNDLHTLSDRKKDKTFEEFYNTCEYGGQLMAFFAITNPEDRCLRALVAGHCANTNRSLMKDGRSIKAVDATISFGEGKITKEELWSFGNASADAWNYVRENWKKNNPKHPKKTMAAKDRSLYIAFLAIKSVFDKNYLFDIGNFSHDITGANIFRKYISIDKFNIKK